MSRLAKPLISALVGFLLSQSTAWAAEGPPFSAPAELLFSRHFVPLASRLGCNAGACLGCNAGACHGMVQGKGGLRLSLFGVDPALDHERLLKELYFPQFPQCFEQKTQENRGSLSIMPLIGALQR